MAFTLYKEERSTATMSFFIPATLMAIVTECERFPETPVTVIVDDAGTVELEGLSVMVLPPAGPDGVNDAVTPAGSPDAVMLTLPVKPPRGDNAIAVETLCPCVNDRIEAEGESVKSLAPEAGEGRMS